MIYPTRGLGTACAISRVQWRRLASSSARRPGPRKQPPQTRIEPKSGSSPKAKPHARPPPDTPPEPPATLLSVWRTSWLPLTGAVLLAGCLGYYVVGTATATYISSTSPPACTHEHATPTGRPPALSGENATAFDRELDLPEWWMGITKLRRQLAARAEGQVLELAIGSGRNLEYYDWEPLNAAVAGRRPRWRGKDARGVTSFTGLDISPDMLDVARRRLAEKVPPMASSGAVVTKATMRDNTGGTLSYLGGHLRLVHSDAHRELPPPPRGGEYDTIIQTFGLCSVSDPVAVLRNLASAVKRDSGRIYLLEHGKGWYGIVNGLLDRNAGKHFDKYGCWWNRDIQELVEEAARGMPGLEVVKVERPNVSQMGTLVMIELRMASSQA